MYRHIDTFIISLPLALLFLRTNRVYTPRMGLTSGINAHFAKPISLALPCFTPKLCILSSKKKEGAAHA